VGRITWQTGAERPRSRARRGGAGERGSRGAAGSGAGAAARTRL